MKATKGKNGCLKPNGRLKKGFRWAKNRKGICIPTKKAGKKAGKKTRKVGTKRGTSASVEQRVRQEVSKIEDRMVRDSAWAKEKAEGALVPQHAMDGLRRRRRRR